MGHAVTRTGRSIAMAIMIFALPSSATAVGTHAMGNRTIEHYGEDRYLGEVMDLLEEAIATRVTFDRALRVDRPAAEYQPLLDEFRSRQLSLLLRLRALDTPPRLIPFHEQLRSAIVTQTRFYSALVAAKIRDPHVNVEWMAGHPALRASSDALRAAFEHLRRLHPAISIRLEAVIESQLSWLEVI